MQDQNKTAENGEKNFKLYKEKLTSINKDQKKFLAYINKLTNGNANMKDWKPNQHHGKKEKDNY